MATGSSHDGTRIRPRPQETEEFPGLPFSGVSYAPQRQKQAVTQMRGAGCDGEQPHISFGPVHSLSLVHSLWHVHIPAGPGPPHPQR